MQAPPKPSATHTSDEDEDTVDNPMVATFQDDLDSSDDEVSPVAASKPPPTSVKVASAHIVLSSDEEEPKPVTDSDSDPETVSKLTAQFNASVPVGEITAQRQERSEGSDSSEESGDGARKPVILSLEEDLSEGDMPVTSSGRPTGSGGPRGFVSSKTLVLTDSDEDRPHVMPSEQLSSEEEENRVS